MLFSDGLVEPRDESLTGSLERLRVAVSGLQQRHAETSADHVLEAPGATDRGSDDVALLVLTHP